MHITLGHDASTQAPIRLPLAAFDRHLHLPGTTGAGKTTALLTMLHQLAMFRKPGACHFVVDFMGGLCHEFLLWASSKFCPDYVRERILYIRCADAEHVVPINPLRYGDLDEGFFKTNRAMDLLLRAWNAQNLGEQPRLARWLFNCLWAMAQLGLCVSDAVHLLLPGSPWHESILAAIPPRLRMEWNEILDDKRGRSTEILDSTRNRMKPFFESSILRSIFGSAHNRVDWLRFLKEKRIVLLDLAPHGKLATTEANAIAGIILNELLSTVRSLPRHERYPVFCWLDECQRIITPDLQFALPEVRQLGVKLVLAHQSFSQLIKPDVDLSSLIWLPNTRLVFAEAGLDADIVAAELASLNYDPKRIKEELYSVRQLQNGHRYVETHSSSVSCSSASQWSKSIGEGWTNQSGGSQSGQHESTQHSHGHQHNHSHGEGGSHSQTESHGTQQQLIPILETFQELSSRQFLTFEEQKQVMAQRIRQLKTGRCLLKCWNDPTLYDLKVKESRPGFLSLPPEVIHQRFPQVNDNYQQLLERIHQQDCFVSADDITQETTARLQRVLKPVIAIESAAPWSGV